MPLALCAYVDKQLTLMYKDEFATVGGIEHF